MTSAVRLPSSVVTPSTYPYQSSLSSSASSSSSSVFSVDAASQSSESSVYSTKSDGSDRITWDTEDPWKSSKCREQAPTTVKRVLPPIKTCDVNIAPEQRQHPRRCSIPAQRPPPALTRQSERKGQFVECLVDSATQMVEVIWPCSVPHCPSDAGRPGVLPLRTFIQETLRRSRTSFSTLQVALYYLILIKSYVPGYDFTMEQRDDMPSSRALQCGRRMFLAALILASKYLQDRNYSARAWSRISGLKTEEINTNEMAFLKAVNWKLHVPESLFERWQDILMKYTSQQPPTPGSSLLSMTYSWKSIVPRLTPALDTVDVAPRKQFNMVHPEPRRVSPITPRYIDVSGSNDTTPTPASPLTILPPRFLEPSPNMLPPTPSLVRLGPLPTPILTPQSAVSNTPAVSLAGYNSRRPSMCSAMSQAQNACMSRSTMDFNWSGNKSYHGLEAYHMFSARRPSVQSLSGSSLTSSPESMISDNSSNSRSSRASSISSASSLSSATSWAPTSSKLNRLATLRCAGLPLAPCKEPEVDYFGAVTIREVPSLSDMDDLKLSDAEHRPAPRFGDEETCPPTVLPIRQRELPHRESSPSKGRKRGRSSVDLSLHQNVRQFLDRDARSYLADASTCVIPDRSAAEPSIFLQSPCPSGMKTPTSRPEYTAKALQSPARSIPERRLPIQKDTGRKRACCASEAASVMTFSGGPGMWSDIL